jgi:DNA-binding transcriptional LysR family regulator
MLNLDRLRALHAVSAHGSIIAAAETLNVTTSAVSQQLAKLELETGQTLLERHGRGVRLTDAAAALVSRTQRVLSLLEEAEAELEGTDAAVAGQITIAAFATAARGLAPQALRSLRAKYRQLGITFHEQEPHESIPRLIRRDVDLIIINDWQNAPIALPDGLTKAPLFDDVADIALPPGHRLAGAKSIRLSDLSGEEWIAWPSGSICHDFLLHTLRKEGHEPKIAHTAAEYETQLALVAAGLGCCVLPRLGRGSVPPGVTVVQSEPALRRHVYAAWRTHSTRRAVIQATVEEFQNAGKKLAATSRTPLPSSPAGTPSSRRGRRSRPQTPRRRSASPNPRATP